MRRSQPKRGPTRDLKLPLTETERACFDALAAREYKSLSRWLLETARERAVAEGADPDRSEEGAC